MEIAVAFLRIKPQKNCFSARCGAETGNNVQLRADSVGSLLSRLSVHKKKAFRRQKKKQKIENPAKPYETTWIPYGSQFRFSLGFSLVLRRTYFQA